MNRAEQHWLEVKIIRNQRLVVLNKSTNLDKGVFKTWSCVNHILSSVKEKPHFSSVTQSCPTLGPHGLQHARPPCPLPTPRVYSNSCPLSQWCHPIISSSVVPFSSCLQSFPGLGSFPMSKFFTSSGQSIGVSVSASVLPMNIQDWFPLGWTGWISLQSKGLLRVSSNTTVQKHQFFNTHLLYSPTLTSIHDYWINLGFD